MRLLAGVCGKETADKKCGYLLHKINIKSDGKIVPCNKVDKNPFYLSRPIEELYHDIKFRDYILDKIDSCNHCLIKK